MLQHCAFSINLSPRQPNMVQCRWKQWPIFCYIGEFKTTLKQHFKEKNDSIIHYYRNMFYFIPICVGYSITCNIRYYTTPIIHTLISNKFVRNFSCIEFDICQINLIWLHRGPYINDVLKIWPLLDPPPPCAQVSQIPPPPNVLNFGIFHTFWKINWDGWGRVH